MIEESQRNIRRLRGLADVPLLDGTLRCAVVDILHAEGLRLEMLRSAYEELGESAAGPFSGAHSSGELFRTLPTDAPTFHEVILFASKGRSRSTGN